MGMLLGSDSFFLKGSGKGEWSMPATSNFPFVFRVLDLISATDSGETVQNSEPSIAINPVNSSQMIVGAGDVYPFFISTNGGATWSSFGTLTNSDKSIAWKSDGSAVLVSTVQFSGTNALINTYSATLTSGFSQVNSFSGNNDNDQPWIRTGPSNRVYVAYNDPTKFGNGFRGRMGDGKTANVLISTDGGASYRPPVPVDKVGTTLGDGPAVRLAVNGNTVYAAFVRWNSFVDSNTDGNRFNSQLVVVRSDNGGDDNFGALGTGGNGVQVATTIDANSNNDSQIQNSPLSLGQERVGSDVAIAVDPNNAKHVLVVSTNAQGATRGQLQLVVSESTDGGETWLQKFLTSSATRSAQPALAILANGAMGLLYDNYDPATDRLSQHLLTTTDDFATTNDVSLASESNKIPLSTQQALYVGDFFDLTGIGNTFYGVFSASNVNNGTDAVFKNTTFTRNFIGKPGESSFKLIDTSGNAVDPSIDPFFFSYSILNPNPAAGGSANMVLSQTGTGQYQIYNLGNNSISASYWLGQVGTDWGFVTLGGFNDGDTSDMLLRNSASGAFQVYNVAPNNNNITGSASLGTVGSNWQVMGFGNFGSLGTTDMMLRDVSTGLFRVYNINNNSITGNDPTGPVGVNWEFSGVGNFSGRGTSDMLLRDADTGQLRTYNINSNQITGSAIIGTVGVNWEFSGVGNFSSVPGESDLILRDSDTGALLIYDINNNRLTGTASIGKVGLDWQFAGVASVSAPGASDLVLRNINTGAFQVYDIANNQLTGSASLGAVGLDWQLGGFAANAPGAAMGSSDNSTSQLVQAMAGFDGGGGATDTLNAVPLGADTSQQTLLTMPQHA
jgi:hypothetical protein